MIRFDYSKTASNIYNIHYTSNRLRIYTYAIKSYIYNFIIYRLY